MIGRLLVGLLRGEGELSEAEKKGLRSFSSIPTGLCVSGSKESVEIKQRERNKTGGETEMRDPHADGKKKRSVVKLSATNFRN